MVPRKFSAIVVPLLLVTFACNRDPEQVKKAYVERGNEYFKNGNYRGASIMYRSALKKDMRYGEAYYRLGLTEIRLGRYTEAVRSLRRALELQPDNLDAATQLADIYLQAYLSSPKRPANLLKELEEIGEPILKKDPKSFLGLRIKGYLALAAGNHKDAADAFAIAHSVQPYSRQIIIPYIQSLAETDRFAEAEKLAHEAVAKDKTFSALYDWMYLQYIKHRRLEDAEKAYVAKAANNPKIPLFILQLAGHYFLTRQPEQMTKTVQRILDNPKDFPIGYVQVGDFYFRIRDVDKAVHYYEEGLAKAARSEEKALYQKRLVETLVARGRKQEALDLVSAVLKENPKDYDAIAMRASLWLQDGSKEKVQNAISELNSVIIRNPENFVLRYNLGRAYVAKGDLDQAIVQFREAIKYRPEYTPARIALAKISLARREWTKALQEAEDILTYDANNITARMIRTSCRMGLGDLPTARAELNQILAVSPDFADALFQMGILNYQEKKYKEAEENFLRLQATAPNDPRGLIGRVETLVGTSRFDDAIRLLQEDLQKNPERSFYRLALANTCVRAKKYDTALAEYRKLLEKNPKNFDVQIRLAETLRMKGDIGPAIAEFEKAKQLNPNDSVAYVRLALLYEGQGNRERARPLYEQILKIEPDNVIALNNLAFIMAETGGDLDQALTMAQRAKAKFPNESDIADTLGWIYLKKNLNDPAIKIFQELTAKDDKNPIYRYHLGMALAQKGDKAGAKRELEIALKNKPSSEDEAKIRALMARI